jgi:hypothetical protein
MIIVALMGGLGNQMFQYAAGRRLAYITNQEIKIDVDFFTTKQGKDITKRNYELSGFNIVEDFATKKEIRKFKNIITLAIRKFFPGWTANPYVKEKQFQIDPTLLSLKREVYIEGHWISEGYFHDITPIIRQDFKFKREIPHQANSIHLKIRACNSICIQVRRGDYITNKKVANVHQTTSLDFFKRAIEIIKSKVPYPVFFIFSDDPEWCEENFRELENVCFVEREFPTGSTTNYLQLMASCKHFIISNSTFAWWGAWLSDWTEKIVIAPKKWVNDDQVVTDDVYPTSWIKI